jgi:hypothetical protein
VSNSIEAANVGDCLLRPANEALHKKLFATASSDHQGVGIYHDTETARYCFAVAVSGDNNNVGKRCEDNKKKLKKLSNYFSQQYPSSKLTLPELGGYSGLFGNLAFYVGLG